MQREKIILFSGMAVVLLGVLAEKPIESGVRSVIDPNFTKWDALLKKHADSYNIPWRWLKVIILNESSNGTNSRVVRGLATPSDIEGSKSTDGLSWGLMQITLATAKGLEKRVVTAQELNNPDFNVYLSAKLVRELIDRFGFSFEKVMRAYNGGPGNIASASTLPYYIKSQAHLKIVMLKHPGNELSTT